MQSFCALSFSPDVNFWLTKTRFPHILHVFDLACNLINEQREILSVVTGKIGNGPFNLVVEDEFFSLGNLQLESPVSILDNQLILGDQKINMTNVNCWHPCPDWDKFYPYRDKIADLLAELPIPTSQLPLSLTSALTLALVQGDILSAKEISSQLAGLGTGLTPAGDDFIMGALYATWMIHSFNSAESLAMDVSNIAAPLTTSLSAAWLGAAGKGQAGSLWHELLDALVFSKPDLVWSVIKNIMAIGDTSGAESLAGFLGTFHSYMEIKI